MIAGVIVGLLLIALGAAVAGLGAGARPLIDDPDW